MQPCMPPVTSTVHCRHHVAAAAATTKPLPRSFLLERPRHSPPAQQPDQTDGQGPGDPPPTNSKRRTRQGHTRGGHSITGGSIYGRPGRTSSHATSSSRRAAGGGDPGQLQLLGASYHVQQQQQLNGSPQLWTPELVPVAEVVQAATQQIEAWLDQPALPSVQQPGCGDLSSASSSTSTASTASSSRSGADRATSSVPPPTRSRPGAATSSTMQRAARFAVLSFTRPQQPTGPSKQGSSAGQHAPAAAGHLAVPPGSPAVGSPADGNLAASPGNLVVMTISPADAPGTHNAESAAPQLAGRSSSDSTQSDVDLVAQTEQPAVEAPAPQHLQEQLQQQPPTKQRQQHVPDQQQQPGKQCQQQALLHTALLQQQDPQKQQPVGLHSLVAEPRQQQRQQQQQQELRLQSQQQDQQQEPQQSRQQHHRHHQHEASPSSISAAVATATPAVVESQQPPSASQAQAASAVDASLEPQLLAATADPWHQARSSSLSGSSGGSRWVEDEVQATTLLLVSDLPTAIDVSAAGGVPTATAPPSRPPAVEVCTSTEAGTGAGSDAGSTGPPRLPTAGDDTRQHGVDVLAGVPAVRLRKAPTARAAPPAARSPADTATAACTSPTAEAAAVSTAAASASAAAAADAPPHEGTATSAPEAVSTTATPAADAEPPLPQPDLAASGEAAAPHQHTPSAEASAQPAVAEATAAPAAPAVQGACGTAMTATCDAGDLEQQLQQARSWQELERLVPAVVAAADLQLACLALQRALQVHQQQLTDTAAHHQQQQQQLESKAQDQQLSRPATSLPAQPLEASTVLLQADSQPLLGALFGAVLQAAAPYVSPNSASVQQQQQQRVPGRHADKWQATSSRWLDGDQAAGPGSPQHLGELLLPLLWQCSEAVVVPPPPWSKLLWGVSGSLLPLCSTQQLAATTSSLLQLQLLPPRFWKTTFLEAWQGGLHAATATQLADVLLLLSRQGWPVSSSWWATAAAVLPAAAQCSSRQALVGLLTSLAHLRGGRMLVAPTAESATGGGPGPALATPRSSSSSSGSSAGSSTSSSDSSRASRQATASSSGRSVSSSSSHSVMSSTSSSSSSSSSSSRSSSSPAYSVHLLSPAEGPGAVLLPRPVRLQEQPVSTTRQQLLQRWHDLLPHFTAQELALSTWAVVKLQLPVPQHMLQVLTARLLQEEVSSWPPELLCRLVWAWCTLYHGSACWRQQHSRRQQQQRQRHAPSTQQHSRRQQQQRQRHAPSTQQEHQQPQSLPLGARTAAAALQQQRHYQQQQDSAVVAQGAGRELHLQPWFLPPPTHQAHASSAPAELHLDSSHSSVGTTSTATAAVQASVAGAAAAAGAVAGGLPAAPRAAAAAAGSDQSLLQGLQAASLQGAPQQQLLPEVAEQCLAHLLQQAPVARLSPVGLSTLCSSVASLQLHPPVIWMQAVAARSRELLPQLPPRALCSLVWAYGVWRYHPGSAWLEELYTVSQKKLYRCGPQGLAGLGAGLYQLQQQPPAAWCQAYARATAVAVLMRKQQPFSLQQLHDISLAMMQLIRRPGHDWRQQYKGWWYLWGQQVGQQFDGAPACALVGVLLMASSAQVQLPSSWVEAWFKHTAGSLQQLSPRQLVMVGWALLRLRAVPPQPWMSAWQELMGCREPELNRWELKVVQQLSQAALAAGVDPTAQRVAVAEAPAVAAAEAAATHPKGV